MAHVDAETMVLAQTAAYVEVVDEVKPSLNSITK